MQKINKQDFLTKPVIVCLFAFISCLLWGSAFPAIKTGYQLFAIPISSTGSQLLFAGYRFTLAGILALFIGCFSAKKFLFPQRKNWGKIFILSLLQTVIQYLFFYIGLAHTTSVKASIIEGANVFIALLVSSLIFKQDSLTKKKIIGCIIGFLGVILINTQNISSLSGMISINGEGFILFSTVSYAFSSVMMKKYAKSEPPILLSAYQFILGGIILIFCGKFNQGNITTISLKGIFLLVYLAFVSAAAYSLWGILLKYNPVSRIAVYGFMTPVCGVILSAIFLHERDFLGIKALLALLFVCIGIYLVNTNKKKIYKH